MVERIIDRIDPTDPYQLRNTWEQRFINMQLVTVLDANGNPVLDANGQPVKKYVGGQLAPLLDDNGNPILGSDGQPVKVFNPLTNSFEFGRLVPQAGQSTFIYPRAPDGVATDDSSLNSGKYLTTLTLNRVLSLLVDMIKAMQGVAVAQASRLNILVKWQEAYTNQMNSVHAFVSNNGDAQVSDPGNSDNTNRRQSLNLSNSTYTEQMKSNNNLVADTAKGLQTNINATQDAVNQQSNMATSILQQMSSIVQAINK